LTTLRNQHVDISGSKLRFHFRGKSGKEYTVSVQNRQLARIVKRCQDLPGHELFQYIDDDGQRYTIESDDVNAYLQQITGKNFTAKDFRTWSGTVFAASSLWQVGPSETKTQARKNVTQAIDTAAKHLGNTPTICRKCYVHPEVIDSYFEGTLLDALQQYKQEVGITGLHQEEASVLAFLKERLVEEVQ